MLKKIYPEKLFF